MSDASTPTPERARPAAPVHVSDLGFVTFESPDVPRLTEYYTDVLGFAKVAETPDEVFLTTGPEHHSIAIRKAPVARGRGVVGYQITGSVEDAASGLRGLGFEVDVRSDVGPGLSRVLQFTEPSTGSTLQLYTEQEPSGVTQSYDHRPRKLGHVAAYVPSVTRIRAFYEEALGFRWADSIGDFFVFLRCNADHHVANFVQSDARQGMHHIAYEASDLAHLQTMLDNLARHGYTLDWGPGRHAVGHNIFSYHFDPDGNHIELFTQLDQMLDEERGYYEPRPWHEHFPMYPRSWEADAHAMNIWGPVPEGGPIKR